MTMTVILNGQERRSADPLSLADAVALLTAAPSGVAAAVNGEVVRRAAWPLTQLADGDEIEVVTAVQGG
ncbi:MAG TPA: sulfur carrier protein ThiS [Streptosporangiaceae bacterium]|jgi:sulfur carrier protein|nr:sulfur carrier protein ThiS [Streptosporangiaceae bacterium]